MSRFRDLLVARSNALIFRCSVGPGLSFADEPALSEPTNHRIRGWWIVRPGASMLARRATLWRGARCEWCEVLGSRVVHGGAGGGVGLLGVGRISRRGWLAGGAAGEGFGGGPGELARRPGATGLRGGGVCGAVRGPRWSSDGRVIGVSSQRIGGVALVYPDGSCLDCEAIAGSAPAFTTNPAVVTVVSAGKLREYGSDGVPKATLFNGGVSDAVWSSARRACGRAFQRGVGRSSGTAAVAGSGGQPGLVA